MSAIQDSLIFLTRSYKENNIYEEMFPQSLDLEEEKMQFGDYNTVVDYSGLIKEEKKTQPKEKAIEKKTKIEEEAKVNLQFPTMKDKTNGDSQKELQ